ncbi:biotin/lipoyl-binding protein [Anaerocolumna aminovalerica]|uniref:Biotin-requiring enzyme n=1 Tax=Anaerocolumna aminovalerica TaxID=1527 RepID=A0A1I5CM76_9FIRM|nr:biotin/lipoyl-containing protein [Anaerocolumna aminovalerica]SFN88099.1 Biotin-requiring enzyme [Anaerocolumna aminovalerica]
MKRYTITVNGIAYDVSVEEKTTFQQPVAAPAPTPIQTPTVSNTVPVSKPAEPATAPKVKEIPTGSLGNIKIESPMPGKILAIKASIGQVVKRGDVIVILEAMKMENEIVAPSDGTVASINVTEGSMIESGVLLATLTE